MTILQGKSKSTTALEKTIEKPEEKVTVEKRKEGSDDFDKKMRDQILEVTNFILIFC